MGTTPFESARFNLDSALLGMCESMAVDATVKAALREEAQMAELGNGVPPLTETVRIHLMWGQVAEMAAPEFH